ncbi:MAG: putative kinase [Myxococcales bacterium]|nr:putative kinase [Myxococcales bacterium]
MTPYRKVASPDAPDMLICSGLDPAGGAGLIADVRVVTELGGRPSGIITALTVQNTTGVVECHPADPEVIGHQLAFLLSDIEMRAVKIGMIGSTPIAKAIANSLQLTAAPVVWDPILYPSRGDVALADSLFGDAMQALRPHLTLVTPNARELAYMTSLPVTDLASAERAGRALAKQLDVAVLVKGGHLGGPEAIDVLLHAGERHELRGARVHGGEHVHGTGCALSSAIATYLANDRDLALACELAKQYVAARIANPARPGRGAASVL